MAKEDPARPKLVVGIVVDQLRTDYLEYLRNYFNQDGIRRLMRGGTYLRDVDFKVKDLDVVSATGMLYTGTYPSRNGLPSKMVYNPATKGRTPALIDDRTLGNFTSDAFSPANLRVSTISDELSVADNGESRIYSFSADPQQSIIMSGHAGTSACWISNTSGNWASTTYYKSPPGFINDRNYTQPLLNRLDTMAWRPNWGKTEPSFLAGTGKHKPFKYTFNKHDRNVFNQFNASPLGNAEVTDMAIECIRSMKLGNNKNGTDMLNLGYTVAPFRYGEKDDIRPELLDTYLRLDDQLDKLLNAIDQYVGLSNTLIMLSSTGYFDEAVVEDKKYRIPRGEFSMKRASSLLNSYLSAKHGNADYIDEFIDGHIYFDQKVLDSKDLNIHDIAADARTFLVKMSGVADAYTINDILSPSTPDEERLRLGMDPKTGGDIVVTFNPGWEVVDDLRYPITKTPQRETPVLTPVIIYGPGVTTNVISTPVDATAIAPTVSGLLRIRSPNSSVSKPLLLNP